MPGLTGLNRSTFEPIEENVRKVSQENGRKHSPLIRAIEVFGHCARNFPDRICARVGTAVAFWSGASFVIAPLTVEAQTRSQGYCAHYPSQLC